MNSFPPSFAAITECLRKIFPKGTIVQNPFLAFRVGTLDSISIRAKDADRFATCVWSKRIKGVFQEQDSCKILTEDDLIGWLSYIRTEIETGAVAYILEWCAPQNLKDVTEELGGFWGALWVCGIDDVAGRIRKDAQLPWLMGKKLSKEGNLIYRLDLDVDQDQPRQIRIIGEAQFAPRGHNSQLNYRYYIPVEYPIAGASSLVHDGEILVKDMSEARAKRVLTGIYLEALCHYVEETARIKFTVEG